MNEAILLVDDDSMQRKLHHAMLVGEGYRVDTAASAEEALGRARKQRFDLVVSDVLMDQVDGFGLCRRMRQEAELARVPVLLLSAHYNSHSDRDLAHEVGACALVERTPDFETERLWIRTCLDQRGIAFAADQSRSSYEHHLHANANQLARLLDHARNAENRAKHLLDHANDAISVLSLDGIILEANRQWETILGVPPAEMLGQHISAFAPSDEVEKNNETYASCVEEGQTRVVVPLRHMQTGATVYMEFSSQVVDLEGRQVVMSIGRDATERVAATKRIAAAELMYRSLVEQIPDIVFRATATGALLFVTPNVEEVTGFAPSELMRGGQELWLSRMSPDDRAHTFELAEIASRTGVRYNNEYRFEHKDGHWIWLRTRITPLRSEGTLVFEGLISDISDERRLHDSLAQAQKMEAVGRLSGGIAHDFNNILAVIMTNAGFLQDELGANDPRRADAEEIHAAAERAAALTRQLLAFSRKQVLELVPVDLNNTIKSLGKMLVRLIGEDIELSLETLGDLGTVRADVGQLEQVIVNLAVNARDAMPTGGKLKIETTNVDIDTGGAVGADALPAGRYVMISITDTGCGMDAETKRRLFEPFFTTKERGKGTGLGLSTCYGIVQQLGGQIWCYSELGKGTVFKVYLPRIDEAPTAKPHRTVAGLEGRETVLLVEDDRSVRTAVQRILIGYGYRVLLATDAAHACALAAKTPCIDLIVSDIVMPGMSGLDVVARVRAVSPSAGALLMSGYTDHALLNQDLLADSPGFIQKPFSSVAFAMKVREVLDNRGS